MTPNPYTCAVYTGIGSRDAPDEILVLMYRLGVSLAQQGWWLRSGRAPGPDQAFEAGAGDRADIYLPWKSFEQAFASSHGHVLKQLPVHDDALRIAQPHHPIWARLGDSVREMMGRNVLQILGSDLNLPTRFVLCWAPQPKRDGQGRVIDVKGGTGMAVRLAAERGIPVYHLGVDEHRQRIERFLAKAPVDVEHPDHRERLDRVIRRAHEAREQRSKRAPARQRASGP